MTSRQGQVASLYRIDVTVLSSISGISHRLRWRSSLNRTLPRRRFRNAFILTGGWGSRLGPPYQRLPEVGGGNGGAGWLGPSARGTTGERVATILLPNSVAQGDLGWPGLELRPAEMQTNWAYLTQHDTEQNSTHRTATSLPVGGAIRQSMATLAKP